MSNRMSKTQADELIDRMQNSDYEPFIAEKKNLIKFANNFYTFSGDATYIGILESLGIENDGTLNDNLVDKYTNRINLYPSDVQEALRAFLNHFPLSLATVPNPEDKKHSGKVAHWVNGLRDIVKISEGYLEKSLRLTGSLHKQIGFNVSHPGAITKMLAGAMNKLLSDERNSEIQERKKAELSQSRKITPDELLELTNLFD